MFLSLFLSFTITHLSADESVNNTEKKPLEKVSTKKARGMVVSVGYQKIAIETSREGGVAQEMLIPVSDSTSFRGYKKLQDFKRGDTVDVTFEQIFTDSEGGEKTILKTSATEILLVKNADSENKMASKEETVKE